MSKTNVSRIMLDTWVLVCAFVAESINGRYMVMERSDRQIFVYSLIPARSDGFCILYDVGEYFHSLGCKVEYDENGPIGFEGLLHRHAAHAKLTITPPGSAQAA